MKNELFFLLTIVVIHVRTISSIQQAIYIDSKLAIPKEKTIKSLGSFKSNQKDVSTSITNDSATKTSNNVRDTFFSRINEHNKEAFDLLNQLWHSKAGWQHVTTKDGKHLWPLCLFLILSYDDPCSSVSKISSYGGYLWESFFI
jgi:hypothetical protein